MLEKRSKRSLIEELKRLDDFDLFTNYSISDDEIVVTCPKCMNSWRSIPRLHNSRIETCPHCGRVVVVAGKKTVGMKRPDLLKYFVNPFDAYIYNCGSTEKILLKCPDCGYEKYMMVTKLTVRRFACDVCKDGVSFANKFIYYLLKQIQPEWWKTEWHPEWAPKYSYDAGFLLNGQYYAVEMHGGQHYSGSHWSGVWWEDQQRRDQEKIELAHQANVQLITIDCSKTSFDFVKMNIMDSELAVLFDLFQINWEFIAQQCQCNFMKQVCDIYNANPHLSRQEIGAIVGVAAPTVYDYLRDGNTLGWCDYHPPLISEINSKQIEVYDLDYNFVARYPSIRATANALAEQTGIKFDHNRIAKRIREDNPLLTPYKGYWFKWIKSDM